MANFFTGSENQFKQLPTRNPQQIDIQSQLGNQIAPLLQNLLSNRPDFAPLAQQARTQFQTSTIPSLSERFTAMTGGQGGQRSSAFQGALGSAGSQLEQGLASQQQLFNMQNRQQDQGLLKLLLGHSQQPSFENVFLPGQQGALGAFSGGLGYGLGQLPSLFAGGGSGGALMGLLNMLLGSSGGKSGQLSNPAFALSGGLGGSNFGGQNFASQFGQGGF
jgi:hypothetical protein